MDARHRRSRSPSFRPIATTPKFSSLLAMATSHLQTMIYTTRASSPSQNDGISEETRPQPSFRARFSIAIILLNYRTPELAIDCLASLAGQIEPDVQVVVVDNNSGDGSADRIEQFVIESGFGEWIKVIRS